MKIAIVQDGPVYNKLDRTIQKSLEFISRAGKEKADLLVFGECWMSGYPVWLDICPGAAFWDHEPVKEVWQQTYTNALVQGSKAVKKLSKAIQSANLWVVMGANEVVNTGKGNGTIYNSIFTFNNKGKVVNVHRKLMPTYTEKLVHGLGDGRGLRSFDTKFGRLGSLICWEHWMPMARQVMHDQSEDIHIALWPTVKEMHHVASRHYAFEGRCHVVSVGQILQGKELPKDLEKPKGLKPTDLVMRGGSAIYAPNGEVYMKPRYNKREFIVKELDLSSNIKEKMNLSVSGHYQRPDVFRYEILE